MAWIALSQQVQTSFSLSSDSQSSPHFDFLISINDTRTLVFNSYFSPWLFPLILPLICHVKIVIFFLNFKGGGIEMVQWLKVLTAHAWGPSSDPSTHVRWLTGTCTSSSTVSDASGTCGHLNSHVHTSTSRYTDKHIIQMLLKILSQCCQNLGGILVTT